MAKYDTTGSMSEGRRKSALVLVLSLFVFIHSSLYSQVTKTDINSDSEIQISFVNEDIELKKVGSYFNVLKLKNTTSRKFVGMLTISVPESWVLIGSNSTTIDIAPGEEKLIPIRVSIPPGTLGGISYMINADISSDDYYNYAAAYISIERVSFWRMYIPNSQVYVSDFNPEGEMKVHLDNGGNSNELVKIVFRTGKLLEFATDLQSDSVMFVNLAAFSDTVISFRVREKVGMSYAERRAAMQSSQASIINLTASTAGQKRYAGFRVHSLESSFLQMSKKKASPFNIGFSVNNLLSTRVPKVAFKTYGTVLFPENQSIGYNFGFNNLYFSPERMQNINWSQFLRFNIHYADDNTDILVGDRIGAGQLHVLSGTGVKAMYSFKELNTLSVSATRSSLSKKMGAHIGYMREIGDLDLSTGLTLESRTDQGGGHYSFHLGTNYYFLEHHLIRAQFVSSLNKFAASNYVPNDTSVLGIAYRLQYKYDNKRFKIDAEAYNTSLNYIRSNGINRMNMRAEYAFTSSKRISGYVYRNVFEGGSYPNRLVLPTTISRSMSSRVYYTYIKGNNYYRIGPEVYHTGREYNASTVGFANLYSSTEPGLFGSITFKTKGVSTISPTMQLRSMFVKYSSEDPDFTPYELNGLIKYRIGINYYDQAFKFTSYFSSGESMDLYRSLVIDDEPVINQALNIRPYYERYFNNEAIRVSGYMNYTYFLPSKREVTLSNITSDFFMPEGWNAYISLLLYRNVRVDLEKGRISTGDLNLLVGLRKSFDIQQPRLSFHDLTIVGFQDNDGNGIKGPDEKPVTNVLISISRDEKKNLKHKTGFSEISLITDQNGEIFYEDIPEGSYDLSISPLSNLGNLYFLNGEAQTFDIHDDITLYLPLVESYKVAGRVVVDRDPNSSEGKISLEGIRITAVSDNGESYSTLTSGNGSFILGLPKANTYEVSIFNVFGERFVLERAKYKIQFSENRTVNVNFKFKERRRQVQIGGEQLFDFNIGNGE